MQTMRRSCKNGLLVQKRGSLQTRRYNSPKRYLKEHSQEESNRHERVKEERHRCTNLNI